MFQERALSIIPITISVLISLYFPYAFYVMYFTEYLPDEGLGSVYAFLVVVLSVWFIDIESRNEHKIYRTYEYGLLIWIIWPAYVPYYLFKTRGPKGILIFSVFLAAVFLEQFIYTSYWLFYS